MLNFDRVRRVRAAMANPANKVNLNNFDYCCVGYVLRDVDSGWRWVERTSHGASVCRMAEAALGITYEEAINMNLWGGFGYDNPESQRERALLRWDRLLGAHALDLPPVPPPEPEPEPAPPPAAQRAVGDEQLVCA